jgi:hypothetical protein
MRLNELIAKLEEIRDELERQGHNPDDAKVFIEVYHETGDTEYVELYQDFGKDTIIIRDY